MAGETVPLSIGTSVCQLEEVSEQRVRRLGACVQVYTSSDERLVMEFAAAGGLLQRATAAAVYAIHGSPAVVDYPDWRVVRNGETVERDQRGDAGLVFEPAADDGIAVDIARIPTEPYHGPLDGREYDSVLEDGPFRVDGGSLVQQLRGLAEQYVPVRRAVVPATDDEPLEGVLTEIRQLARYHDREGTLEGFTFASTLEQLEALVDPKRDDPAPVATEWLEWYASDSDLVEQFVTEHVGTRPPDRAADLYYALLARGNQQYAERALSALERQPDEKAVPALLMCLWNDDPDTAPGALSVLGALLETHREFTENDRGHDRTKVVDEIVDRVKGSKHPEIRTAAIETLSEASLVGREDVRGAIEAARDDPDDSVRAVAEAALEAEER